MQLGGDEDWRLDKGVLVSKGLFWHWTSSSLSILSTSSEILYLNFRTWDAKMCLQKKRYSFCMWHSYVCVTLNHFNINPSPGGLPWCAEFWDLSHCILKKKETLQYVHPPSSIIMQGYRDGIHFSSPKSIESEWPIYMWIHPAALLKVDNEATCEGKGRESVEGAK